MTQVERSGAGASCSNFKSAIRVRRLNRLRSTAIPVRRGAWTRSAGGSDKAPKVLLEGRRQALTSNDCGPLGSPWALWAVNERTTTGAGNTWSEWRTTRKGLATLGGCMPPAGALLKREDVAALRATPLQHHAAILGLHPGQESVGLRAASIVWLKCAFHDSPSRLTAHTKPWANLRVYWETHRFSMNFSLYLGRC